MEPVLSLAIADVFELTVLGNIEGKQRIYRRRLTDDSFCANTDERLDGPEYLVSEPARLKLFDEAGIKSADNWQTLDFATDATCKTGLRGLPVFFETRYLFRMKCAKAVKNVRVFHRLAQVTDGFTFADGWLFGDIDFINTPGKFTLAMDVAFEDGSSRRIEFRFMVVSVKMDVEGDYREILGVIEKERPGLVQNFLSKTFGDSGFDAQGDPTKPAWYAIFEKIFGYYLGAARQIVQNPHRRYVTVAEDRHPDQIRRWTPRLANRFNAMPKDRRETAWMRVERIEAETDTQENRFVLHTLREISRQLKEFAATYARSAAISNACREDLDDEARQLDELTENPFFRGVGRYAGGGTQSLVLQQRAGYAQVLSAWILLKNALTPQGEGVEIGYRPLSALYEFWTFLTTRDVLRKILVDEQGYAVIEDPKIADLAHLLDDDDEQNASSSSAAKTLCRMGYRFEKDGRKVLLAYQQTYGTDETGENFAVTYDQRPDIVLSIRETGGEGLTLGASFEENVYTYLFDAKYRVDELGGKDASPRDAIDDMHRYRDAILYRRQKAGWSHEIIGAYVLFPGRPGGHSYDYASMRDSENIGAFPLLPKHIDEFEGFIRGLLDKGSKKEHLERALPPRGAEIALEPVVGEDQILTVLRLTVADIESAIIHRTYIAKVEDVPREVEEYRRIRFQREGNAAVYATIKKVETMPASSVPEFAGKPEAQQAGTFARFELEQ